MYTRALPGVAFALLAMTCLFNGNVSADDSVPHAQIDACAEQGDPPCQLALGLRYMQGAKTGQDWQKAESYILQAVEQGYTPSYTGMCSLYLRHPDRDKYFEKAIGFCEDAAYLADTFAHITLGAIYEMDGPLQDLEKSYLWYFIASHFTGPQMDEAKQRLRRIEGQLSEEQITRAKTNLALVLMTIDRNLRRVGSAASTR